MGILCDRCGQETSLKELVSSASHSGMPAHLCTACQTSASQRKLYLYGTAIVLLFTSLYLWRQRYPDVWLACFAWNMFLLQFFETICVLPHELAHAVTAKSLGLKVGRIALGWGRALANFRLGPLEFTIGERLLGGFVEIQQIPPVNWRWKMVAMCAAGPLANLLLAATAAFLFLPPWASLKFDLGGPVSPWLLFIIANVCAGLINLVPFTVAIPQLGIVPSDGLSLKQLVWDGQLPHVPAPDSPVYGLVEPAWKKTLRIVSAILMVMLAFLLVLSGIIFTLSGWMIGESKPKHLIAGLVMLLLAGGLFWLTAKRLRPAKVLPLDQRPPGLEEELGTLSVADVKRDTWPANVSPPILQSNLFQALSSGDYAGAHDEVESSLRATPGNLWLQCFKADVLTAQGRHLEADDCLHTIIQRDDLRSTSRIYLENARLARATTILSKEEIRARVATILEKPYSAREKAWLLDCLSCLPFMFDLPEYLPDAREWINEAMKLAPDSPTLQGTYAALLVESGERMEEAELIFLNLLKVSPLPQDQSLSAFYLALLTKRRNDQPSARKWLRKALQRSQPPWMLKRAEREFAQ